MSNVSQWSIVASSNDATPPDGWPEQQSRSSVNDCARENMAALARWYKDSNGSLVTTGTDTAFVLTTNAVDAALADTSLLAFRVHLANSASPTLNRDATGAKAIRTLRGEALPANAWAADQVVVVAYNATDDVYNLVSAAIEDLPMANTSTAGILETATESEMEAAAVNNKIVTPNRVHRSPYVPKLVTRMHTLFQNPVGLQTLVSGLGNVSAFRNGQGDYSLSWGFALTQVYPQALGWRTSGDSTITVTSVSGASVRFVCRTTNSSNVDPDSIFVTIWGDIA